MLEKHRYQDRPERFEYRLTEKGLDLWPVIVSLLQWGDKYAAPGGPPVLLTHKGCGGAVDEHRICARCGEPLVARSVRAVAGPGRAARRLHGPRWRERRRTCASPDGRGACTPVEERLADEIGSRAGQEQQQPGWSTSPVIGPHRSASGCAWSARSSESAANSAASRAATASAPSERATASSAGE